MTVITNARLISSYNSVPSDNVQQIWSGIPTIISVGKYQAIPIASITANKSMTGGYRLSVSGRINDYSDLMFYYVKNGEQIDFSCPYGWWCGTPPYYFTYTRDFIDNINVGDVFEIYAYDRYIQPVNVTINDFTIKYSDVQLPILSVVVLPCEEQIISGKNTYITGHVIDDAGNSIESANISLLTVNGAIDPISGVTDINGDFKFTYTAPTVTETKTFTITGTASKSGYIDGSGSGPIIVTPETVAIAGPGDAGKLLLAGLLFGLLLHKRCEDNKNKEDCEKNESCQWKSKINKCISFTREQKFLIDTLRKQGAKGIPSCEKDECRIGEWLAIYRKGERPIIKMLK